MKFYDPEELLGALVVDSAGLVYGVVGGYRLAPEGVVLEAYVSLGVDADALRRALRERGVEPGGEGVEALVLAARRLGLEIPRVGGREVRVLKGLVRPGEISLIDVKVLENPSTGAEERVGVVLLGSQREAEFRGLRFSGGPVVDEGVVGKLCVSASNGVLGYVYGFVVGAGESGLRACRRRGRVELNWASFLSEARRLAGEDAYYRLVGFRDPLKSPRLSGAEVEEARRLLSEMGLLERLSPLLESHSKRTGPAECADVPLRDVLAAREVVLVK